MKQTLTNARMSAMCQQLEPVLSQRGRLGYAAWRNYHALSQCLAEYNQFRDELIEKYGEKQEDGQIVLKIDSPRFEEFAREMAPYNVIEHEVELMTARYDDVTASEQLSGADILFIDWMLED